MGGNVDKLREELEQLEQAKQWQGEDGSSMSSKTARLQQWVKRREGHQTLKELRAVLFAMSDKQHLQTNLTDFLATRWNRIKYSCLSYTALPDDPITKLCLHTASYLHQLEPSKKIYQYLMPTLCLFEDRLSILAKTDIDHYPLDQCILDSDAMALIPVAEILANINPHTGVTLDRLTNPFKNNGNQLFTTDEKERLLSHSKVTMHLDRLLAEIKRAEEQSLSLSYKLKQLAQDLRKGGVRSGEGTFEKAGESAMVGLVGFIDYWDSLTKRDKRKAEQCMVTLGCSQVSLGYLIKELTRKNRRWGQGSSEPCCVEEEAYHLDLLLWQHKDSLHKINSQIDTRYLAGLYQELECVKNLMLRQPSIGRDPLGFSSNLLEKEDFIDDPDGYVELVRLIILLRLGECDADEEKHIRTTLKEKASRVLSSVTDLIEFLNDLGVDERKILLDAITDQLPKIIKSAEDLSEILKELHTPLKERVLTSLNTCLPELISSMEDLTRVFRSLHAAQKQKVLAKIIDKLPGIIKSIDGLVLALRHLNLCDREVLLGNMQNRLTAIINSTEDLNSVFKLLTVEQCTMVCKNLDSKLPEIIKTSVDLLMLLRPFSTDDSSVDELSIVLEQMSGQLAGLIKFNEDLKTILTQSTPKVQCVIQNYLLTARVEASLLQQNRSCQALFYRLIHLCLKVNPDRVVSEKLLVFLKEKKASFADAEITALDDGSLKKLISKYKQLPDNSPSHLYRFRSFAR